MRDAVIVDAVRTPLGKRGGGLSATHPARPSSSALKTLESRVGLDPAVVDDVIWGCVTQVAEQAANVTRYAVLGAGWPEEVPAVTIDRQCSSSQQAVHFAAAGVRSGQYDVAVAGGVEVMSRVPMGSTRIEGLGSPFGPDIESRYGVKGFNQGVSADLIARRWSLSRTQLDEHSLQSHTRAAAAQDEGRYAAEIAAVETTDAAGQPVTIDADEGVRRGATLDSLAKLKPAFAEDGLTTAGSSSQISDGAATLSICSSEVARQHSCRALARLHSFAMRAPNNSSQILDDVEHGQIIEVTNYGEVAAVLIPPAATPYERLLAAGTVRTSRPGPARRLRCHRGLRRPVILLAIGVVLLYKRLHELQGAVA
jgi:acetyl-CoA acyltransferase